MRKITPHFGFYPFVGAPSYQNGQVTGEESIFQTLKHITKYFLVTNSNTVFIHGFFILEILGGG